MNNETWKCVKGFHDYKISSYGRVLGKYGRILSPCIVKDNYRRVTLQRCSMYHYKYIAVLVAEAFISLPPSNIHQVNHKDGNKAHNNVDNLEWMTPSENSRHSMFVLGKYALNAKLNKNSVVEIREEWLHFQRTTPKCKKRGGCKIKQKELATKYNVCAATIRNIIYRQSWKHL